MDTVPEEESAAEEKGAAQRVSRTNATENPDLDKRFIVVFLSSV
jgi:hypothetical protein